MAAEPVLGGGAGDLQAPLAAATARLEREAAALRQRVAALTAELEGKDRLLAAGLARERGLEAAARRQSRLGAMGAMVATLAHEVRNPLGVMELFTGLLLQDLRGHPEACLLARQVARGIADLNRLVTNLLEFTRTREVHTLVVDCCALLEEALRDTADLRAAQRITVARRYAAAAVPALADPDLLRPVLRNLVRNALQAMPEGGTLTLAADRGPGAVRVAVGDTGPGIPPGAEEDVFRPFYTTRAGGTGLGLAVARDLVDAMRGSLTVESAPGRGAIFTVALPEAA